jgi:hypothetical protein
MYGSLNDFLPDSRRHVDFRCSVQGPRSVKDLIESLGVPHPEIDLVLVNGVSVPFGDAIRPGDRIAVFPRFTSVDIGSLSRVRPPPLEAVRFITDVHLGKLARDLRLGGLDTEYRPDADDETLAELAGSTQRILLTRDVGLLKRGRVTYGYFVRATEPPRQLVEVLRQFGPLELRPFSRCLRCNGVLREVPKEAVAAVLPPRTRQDHERFSVCRGCGRIYWQGSHWQRLEAAIEAARQESERPGRSHSPARAARGACARCR